MPSEPVDTGIGDACRVGYRLPQAQTISEGRRSIEDVGADRNLAGVAFDKAWLFIKNDPFLAHNSVSVLCERLQVHLDALIKLGEDNMLDLANKAIWNLRAELGRDTPLATNDPPGQDLARRGKR
ncbi:hypothetical protein [Bradyrhizobium liaoningense]